MNIHSSDEIVFKANNRDEVIQSLANYFRVPVCYINEENLKDVYQKGVQGISDVIWEMFHLNKKRDRPNTFKAYGYHKTKSNKKKSWFSKGLLSKDDGIRNFIINLESFYNIDLSKFEEKLADKCREKNKIDNDDGPYGFIFYEYAKRHYGFKVPEVFTDFSSCDELQNLVQQAENILYPTIVVFWYRPNIEYLDKYIHAYCSIILDNNEYEYASFDRYEDIPFEQITEVISDEM